MKQILLSSVAALTVTLGGLATTVQAENPLISGDEPMNIGQEGQLTAPTPDAAAQEKTGEMLRQQGVELTGDEPMNIGQEGQITDPTSDPEAQAKTAADLEAEDDASGAISGKYD
ncbi:hypothetical protein CKO25_07490 [Thiocapsa imhoffii]|uniref:Uncharacterized protein n=1 Tax=Thiocapsa imhoffii TaxID=382777 RepID=A0A9X0WHP5_9GAMM|nr:hypothetical protein [Thiocapsa imhoffii]